MGAGDTDTAPEGSHCLWEDRDEALLFLGPHRGTSNCIVRGRGTGAAPFGRAGTALKKPFFVSFIHFWWWIKKQGVSRTLGSVVRNAETSLAKLLNGAPHEGAPPDRWAPIGMWKSLLRKWETKVLSRNQRACNKHTSNTFCWGQHRI